MTADDFRKYFSYDSKTGVITRIKRTGQRTHIGDVAGSLMKIGYLRFRFKGKQYLAHRVGWLMHYGVWPINQLDHKNGIRDQNWIDNLRESNDRKNSTNRGVHRAGKLCGYQPYETKNGTMFRARLRINGKTVSIGSFKTKEQAHLAYINKVKEIENEQV